jgi:replicative DNA helicase
MPSMTDAQPNTPSHFEYGHAPNHDGQAEPPFNVEAERAVLGACMHDSDVIDAVRPILGDDAFYRPAHETVWRALLALHREGRPTDPIVLTELLQEQGDLQRVGGHSYLHQLADALYGTGNAEHHAEIIRKKADLRRLHASAVRTVQRAQEPGADPDEIRSEIEAEACRPRPARAPNPCGERATRRSGRRARA